MSTPPVRRRKPGSKPPELEAKTDEKVNVTTAAADEEIHINDEDEGDRQRRRRHIFSGPDLDGGDSATIR